MRVTVKRYAEGRLCTMEKDGNRGYVMQVLLSERLTPAESLRADAEEQQRKAARAAKLARRLLVAADMLEGQQ